MNQLKEKSAEQNLCHKSPIYKVNKWQDGVDESVTEKLAGKPFIFKLRLQLAINELTSALAIEKVSLQFCLRTCECMYSRDGSLQFILSIISA